MGTHGLIRSVLVTLIALAMLATLVAMYQASADHPGFVTSKTVTYTEHIGINPDAYVETSTVQTVYQTVKE